MIRYDTASLYRVFQIFYDLTNIRIALADEEGNLLFSVPYIWNGFCRLIRSSDEIDRTCVRCDVEACRKCGRIKEFLLYQCHMGLTEAVTPVYDGYGIFGYVMFGQVLSDGSGERVRKKLRKKFPEDRYPEINRAINEIPVISEKKLTAASTVLQALVVYALSNRWIVPGKREFIRILDQYIDEHLDRMRDRRVCPEAKDRESRISPG